MPMDFARLSAEKGLMFAAAHADEIEGAQDFLEADRHSRVLVPKHSRSRRGGATWSVDFQRELFDDQLP